MSDPSFDPAASEEPAAVVGTKRKRGEVATVQCFTIQVLPRPQLTFLAALVLLMSTPTASPSSWPGPRGLCSQSGSLDLVAISMDVSSGLDTCMFPLDQGKCMSRFQ